MRRTTGKKEKAASIDKMLRHAAEDILANRASNPSSLESLDQERLLHEMQVHQIELELQNDELTVVKDEAEALAREFLDLYDFAPIGYVTLSPEGNMLRVNLTGARLLGVERSNLVGAKLISWVMPESLPEFNAFFKRIFISEKSETCEIELAKNGKPALAAQLQGGLSPDGKECRLAVIDISERRKAEECRKQAEKKLAYREAMYRELVQNANSAIIRWRKDGTITFFNEYAQRFFGYQVHEVLDKHVNMLIPEMDSIGADLSHLMRSILDCPERYHKNINENVRKDGSRVWMSWSNRPILDERGEVAEVLAVGCDITDVIHAEISLHEKQKELQETNKELESFSYSVSHDLKAPLRAVDGFVRMIQKKKAESFDEETRRMFEVIRTNTGTMDQLIDGLLNFSRLGKRELILASVDVLEILKDVWMELESVNCGRAITLKIGDLPPAMADRMLLKQVIYNLLSNAVKFTGQMPEAVIEVGSCRQNNEVAYYIKDNGIGFDMKYYEKLFRIFQRLHSPDAFEGTGVGLAIIQRIIKRHGGRVWAEGKVNQGATFYFTLPSPAAE